MFNKKQVLLILLCSLLLLLFIAVSPILLRAYADGSLNWNKLSAISQSYTAAGSIASALALVGVSIALILQARQNRVAQVQAVRQMQLELMKLAISDSGLLNCWGPATEGQQARERIYTNLIFKYLETGFVIGEFSEASLRRTLANRMSYETGFSFWHDTRDKFRIDAATRKRKRYVEIADELYRVAAEERTNRQPDSDGESTSDSESNSSITYILAFIGGAATAVVAILGRRRFSNR